MTSAFAKPVRHEVAHRTSGRIAASGNIRWIGARAALQRAIGESPVRNLDESTWGLPDRLTEVSDGGFRLRFKEPMRVEFWPEGAEYQCRVEYLHPSLTGSGRLPVDAMRNFERNVVFHFRRLYHASPRVEGDEEGVRLWERLEYAMDIAHYERTYQRPTETALGTIVRNNASGVQFRWDDPDLGRTEWPSEETAAVIDLPTFRAGDLVRARFYIDAGQRPAELIAVNAYTRPTAEDRRRVRDALRHAKGPSPQVSGQ